MDLGGVAPLGGAAAGQDGGGVDLSRGSSGTCTASALSSVTGQRLVTSGPTIQTFVTTMPAGTSSVTIPINSVDSTPR